MGEFIEYVRQEFLRVNGTSNPYKRMRPKDEQLAYDSVSNITDLSEEGILTQSQHLISKDEKKRLSRYMSQLRTLQGYTVPKHDCLKSNKNKKLN
jgi:hypothetical protein